MDYYYLAINYFNPMLSRVESEKVDGPIRAYTNDFAFPESGEIFSASEFYDLCPKLKGYEDIVFFKSKSTIQKLSNKLNKLSSIRDILTGTSEEIFN